MAAPVNSKWMWWMDFPAALGNILAVAGTPVVALKIAGVAFGTRLRLPGGVQVETRGALPASCSSSKPKSCRPWKRTDLEATDEPHIAQP
jgi:hypothetical protein